MALIATVLRKIGYPLITKKGGYFIGMLFVRLGRQLRKRYFNKHGLTSEKRTISIFGDVQVEVELGSYMGGSLFWFGMHHVNEIIVLNKLLKSNFTFIDVGANQGEFTVFAASKLKHGKVIAFEPVQKQFSMLVKNVQLNAFNNVELNPYGLSDEIGEFPIFTSINSSVHSGVHEGLSSLFQSETRDVLEQVVQLKIFDDEYEKKLERFDVLKIDIEGAELFALRGMKKSLMKFKPLILIEINNETFNQAGYSSDDVINYLSTFGYEAYKIFRGKLIKVDCSKLDEWGNYIFKAS